MAEINQVDILVKADVPAIVDNQQLLVYVPVATNSNYGIVKPDGDDLTVENGILKLKEGGSVQQGQLDKKVDKLTNSSTLIGDDILKLYAQDNEGQEGYVSGSKGSLENTVAIRTAEGTLKSQRAQTDWDLVPLKQVKEIAQANNTPEAITDSTLDANIGQNAITHKSIEKWTYNETGKSEYVNVDRRIPIIAGKGIKFVKNDDLKAISIYTDLEAKLNENIFKNPEKTYLVWKGANFPNSDTAQTIFDVGTVIDFGDGEAPTVITEAWANTKVTHTYFDDTDYHIITITYPDTNARAIRANKYNGCTGLIYILTSRYITSIEEGAFSNCGKLDYLYLPNVSTIGNYAFQGMGTILDIDMPAVTSIGEYCFQGSKYSKHIVFPKLHTISVGALQIFEDVELGPDLEAVTIIKQFALNNCKVLTISDEKQSVLAEQNAFSNKLKRIYVPKSKYSTYISDWVAYYDKIAYKIDSYDLFLELGKCIPDIEKGEANGVATLDASGKVPSSQLPSYVDDVINSYIVGSTPFAADWLSLTAGGSPLTPEEGKIYIIVSEGAYSNNSYRWSGTVYAPVGSPIAVLQQTGQSTTDVMSQKATTDSLAYEVDIKFDTDIDYNYGEVEILTSNVGNKFTVKLTDIYGAALKDSIAVGMAIDILDSNKDSLDLGISVISYIDYTTGEIHIEFKGSRSFSDGDIPAGGFISVVNKQFYGPIILPTEIRDLLLTNKSAVFKCSNDIYSLYHVNSSNTMRIYVVGTWGYSDNSFSSTRFILLVRDGTSSGTWYASRMNSAQIYDWNGEAVYRSTQVQIAVNKNIIAQPTFLFITFTGKEFTCTQSAYNQLFKDIRRIDWGDNSPITDYKHTYSQSDDYIINFLPDTTGNIELPSTLLSNITGLKKVVVGDKVTKIGGSLCQGCTTLEEFVIGKNVTDITNFSIISGTPIKTLRVLATTPPTCATYDAQVSNLEKIIVPKSAINAYKAATGWSTYASKIVYEVDSSDIETKYDKTGGTIGGNVDITGDLTVQKKLKCETAPTENNDVLRYQDTAVEVETSLMGA